MGTSVIGRAYLVDHFGRIVACSETIGITQSDNQSALGMFPTSSQEWDVIILDGTEGTPPREVFRLPLHETESVEPCFEGCELIVQLQMNSA